MPALRPITAFVRWRWSPCVALVAATFLYIGIVLAAVPESFGDLSTTTETPNEEVANVTSEHSEESDLATSSPRARPSAPRRHSRRSLSSRSERRKALPAFHSSRRSFTPAAPRPPPVSPPVSLPVSPPLPPQPPPLPPPPILSESAPSPNDSATGESRTFRSALRPGVPHGRAGPEEEEEEEEEAEEQVATEEEEATNDASSDKEGESNEASENDAEGEDANNSQTGEDTPDNAAGASHEPAGEPDDKGD